MRKILLPVSLLLSVALHAQVFTIQGWAFYDVNYSNSYEPGIDSALKDRRIYIEEINTFTVYSVITDGNGYYSLVADAGVYFVDFDDVYDEVNYYYDPNEARYNGNTIETANLVFTPKALPPTYIGANIYNTGLGIIPASGGIQHFTLQYGFTNPAIASMPAKVMLDFSPRLSLINYSVTPSLISAGHVEWNLSSVTAAPINPFTNQGDTIHCVFSFPPVGDTIAAFQIYPSFVPGILIDKVDSTSYSNDYSFNPIHHPEPQSIGATSGVKWIRNLNSSGSGSAYYDNSCVDTAYNDDGYFVAGSMYTYDTMAHYFVSLSKINKDGLPLWEKQISETEFGGANGVDVVSVKTTSDGGCVVFCNVYFTNDSMNKTSLIKSDAAGNITWIKTHGGNKEEYLYSGTVLPDNSFMVTGEVYNLSEYANLVVKKISASGDLLWRKEYGGSRDDAGLKILPLKNGTYLILGGTNSNDGDVHGYHPRSPFEISGTDTFFTPEAWIVNINANGDILWDKCYGGSGYGYFTDAVETGNNILMCGFTASKDGDLPNYPEMGVPLWLLQINNTGTIVSSNLYKFYAGYKNDDYTRAPFLAEDGPYFSSLSVTKDGNFVLGGSIEDNYGTIKSKHGVKDFIFLKVNPAGNIIWQKAVGGTGSEYMTGCIKDKNDDMVFVGNSGSYNDDLYGLNKMNEYREVIGKIGVTNVIKGQVFIDNNNNGIKDASELFYSNGRIQSAKIKDTVTGYIFDGQFLNNVDTGNYVTTYVPANNYYTVSPASKSTSFTTLDQTDVVNFALRPKPNMNDLEVQLIPLSPVRPGFDVYYRIITKNVGTTTISNTVVALKKGSRQTFGESSKALSGSAGDSLWWGPITLNAFDIDTVDVMLVNAVPPGLINGDTVALTATANPVANDSSAANNSMVIKQIVQGSYDPNDKTEIHGGQLTPLAYSNNEYLQYLIRFQNTGTDTAFFVTVKDTFDAKYDLSSIDVIAASHSYNFKLEKNVATWDFKFIKLVDSTTNEKESHGYIMFRVKPKKGLSVGDVFNNNASIYFDYNLPVITNRERTFISDGNGICPGGNIKFTSSVSGSSYQWQVNNGSGYTNITNNTTYSGATTSALQITATSTSLYGAKYRCLVNGNTYSAESLLKFFVKWTGAVNTDWHNAGNWNCGVVPDANTDVQILKGVVNYPVVNNSVSCRSINAAAGVSLLVKSGVQINVTGKK